MSKDKFEIAIMGGGLIGSSIAFHLSEKLKAKNEPVSIALLDVDLEGKYSSSELNAGGVRAEWWHGINIELAQSTIEFLASDPNAFGFRQKGYLWLFDQPGWQGYQKHVGIFKKHRLRIEELGPEQVKQNFSFVDRVKDIKGAIFSPDDGIFNPNLLKQYYRSKAKVNGVVFIDGACVKHVKKNNGKVELFYEDLCEKNPKPDHDQVLDLLAHPTGGNVPQHFPVLKVACDTLINAAGAWASHLALLYGHKVICHPLRRQMSLFNCKEIDLKDQGMIVDSSGLYFHAESDHILAGFATPNEPSGFNFKYGGDAFFESEIWPRLLNRTSHAEALKHLSGWAGLYSVTPDRSGVMGKVDSNYNIYEAHSFTGRGAMQSHGVGLAMSELIIDGKYETIDAASLHPRRFHSAHGKLLYEGMHI